MRGNAALLQKFEKSDDQVARDECILSILHESERLSGVIENLLINSRLSSAAS